MPSNILSIQPRRADFRTQTNADWLDGLVIWQAGAGGILPGPQNIGNGQLLVDTIAPQTVVGHHAIEVVSTDNIPRITVTGPTGSVTAQGATGLPLYAGGITLRLLAGTTAFSVGDTYVISVLPVPIDITGLEFTLQARQTPLSANIAIEATSAPPEGTLATIAAGTTGGQIAMRVLKPAMARNQFTPGTYVYDILAHDPASGLTVPAYYGALEHVDGVTFIS